MSPPRATYRLQLHAGFTFAQARRIVPYLADLGISHVYTSPITTAVPGSMHGYDVIDPTRINPELGGEAELVTLVAALRERGMGLIVDIVPNHMGVAGDANRWWMDVLEHGQASEHAATFDIDWTGPLVLPVLGAPLDAVLAAGDLRLVSCGDRLGLQLYAGAIYPLRRDDPVWSEHRDAAIARHDPATAEGRAALRALTARQHYRPICWRAANDTLNWRRFFSINDLAGLRVEDPAVFARTHRLYADLFARGLIDGVRVDHIDGLADPAAYCGRLRRALEEADPARVPYIVVEKILAADETLPGDWGIDGTSGYDFMREVGAVLHDPSGAAPLEALWTELTGRSETYPAEAFAGRRELLAWQFEGQLEACVGRFARLAAAAGHDWMTRGMLRRAIERLLWTFPVYRTYGTGDGAPASDEAIRAKARAAVSPHVPPGETAVVDLVLDWLGGGGGGEAGLKRDAVLRFQQLAAPIAAKGVEDTAFYRYGALLSANDVGFDPARMAEDVAAFHASTRRRSQDFPQAMLATGTHDHKRGEDARARLAVLSAVPDEWAQTARRWLALAAPYSADILPADVYMLLQTLVGAWDGDARDLLPRVHEWQIKAVREAKRRSSWEAPDAAYEARYGALAQGLTGDTAFMADFRAFLRALEPAALANSLAQAALHCLVPGVPDIYQGAELPDYSMVDPDNRRPVDFARRRALLANGAPGGKLQAIARLLALRRDRPDALRGSYEPLPVVGERSDHVVAFLRRGEREALCCAVAIRLGKALFGGESPDPGPGWWGDTRIVHAGTERLVADIFDGSPFACWFA